ncbi:sigma-70 family RNA polymerase sigma factor [Micromonospora sp. RTGN7]|uniref:RNA polymerase sigma factor n=1 Tax=Micromonospora sp. RTGN7 TaxID=3016526 RepID=UPI0029FECC97|nr:sigma-70 family RNA polymerase sigma factor [Micromonospora sp. RTGN7]
MGSSEPRPKLSKEQRDEIEHLYRQEAENLYRYACFLGWVSESRDLVQTAFHEAIRDWHKIGHWGPVERRKWLRRVLKNKAVDIYRKQSPVDLTADFHPPHSRSDDTDDIGERVDAAIILTKCWKVIEQMPPQRRIVADLVWGESWDPKRVAKHLGLTQSTIRGHLRKARQQLRASIGELVPFIDDEEEIDDEKEEGSAS